MAGTSLLVIRRLLQEVLQSLSFVQSNFPTILSASIPEQEP